MEKLGLKIARDEKFKGDFIRDAWLVEMTGGPNTECDNCPNYTYDDLTDYYWPALVGGVLAYTGEQQVDYVGYSSSGGIGIKSYEKYYLGKQGAGLYVDGNGDWIPFTLPANSVDHMALIGPMGAFDGTSPFTSIIEKCGDDILSELSGNNHINREEILEAGIRVCPLHVSLLLKALNEFLPAGSDISYNFWQDIVNEVQDTSNVNPTLSSINGLLVIFGQGFGLGDDLVVPREDTDYIYNNSNASEKKYKAILPGQIHGEMQDNFITYNPLIANFLNNISYSGWEEDFIVEENP